MTPVDEAGRFFDAFVQAFATFDGAAVAARYACPYLAQEADGDRRAFDTPAAIAAHFQQVLDGYRARGCVACAHEGLEALPLGRDAVLATVGWRLLAADGRALAAWRESYALHRSDGELRIFASIDHAG